MSEEQPHAAVFANQSGEDFFLSAAFKLKRQLWPPVDRALWFERLYLLQETSTQGSPAPSVFIS